MTPNKLGGHVFYCDKEVLDLIKRLEVIEGLLQQDELVNLYKREAHRQWAERKIRRYEKFIK